MTTNFQISTTQYDDDKITILKALSHLQTHCELSDSYRIGDPVARFGWTFFPLSIKPALRLCIEQQFADMLKKTKGQKPDEKLTNFMTDFFQSRGCKVKLKLLD